MQNDTEKNNSNDREESNLPFDIPVTRKNFVESPETLSVESAIRTQRVAKGISVRSLAKLLEISASQLSKIETGKSRLSVDLALKIAGILGVPAAVFLSKGNQQISGRRTITRANTGETHQTPGMVFHPLCSEIKDHEILYWTVMVTSRSLDEAGGWRQHPGQEFFQVISGEVTLLSTLYDSVRLQRGDSILFDSNQPHAYTVEEEAAQLLMINTIV